MYLVVLSKLPCLSSMGAWQNAGAQAAGWPSPFFEGASTLFRESFSYIFAFNLRALLGFPLLSNLGGSLVHAHKLLSQKKGESQHNYWVFGKSLLSDAESSMTQTLPLRDSIMVLYLHYITFFTCLVITYIWWRGTWLQETSSRAPVRVSRWFRRVSGLAQITVPGLFLTFSLGY